MTAAAPATGRTGPSLDQLTDVKVEEAKPVSLASRLLKPSNLVIALGAVAAFGAVATTLGTGSLAWLPGYEQLVSLSDWSKSILIGVASGWTTSWLRDKLIERKKEKKAERAAKAKAEKEAKAAEAGDPKASDEVPSTDGRPDGAAAVPQETAAPRNGAPKADGDPAPAEGEEQTSDAAETADDEDDVDFDTAKAEWLKTLAEKEDGSKPLKLKDLGTLVLLPDEDLAGLPVPVRAQVMRAQRDIALTAYTSTKDDPPLTIEQLMAPDLEEDPDTRLQALTTQRDQLAADPVAGKALAKMREAYDKARELNNPGDFETDSLKEAVEDVRKRADGATIGALTESVGTGLISTGLNAAKANPFMAGVAAVGAAAMAISALLGSSADTLVRDMFPKDESKKPDDGAAAEKAKKAADAAPQEPGTKEAPKSGRSSDGAGPAAAAAP